MSVLQRLLLLWGCFRRPIRWASARRCADRRLLVVLGELLGAEVAVLDLVGFLLLDPDNHFIDCGDLLPSCQTDDSLVSLV